MTGREFVRRPQAGKETRPERALDPSAGKGDHATPYLNGRKTIVADMHKDIPRGTFHNMCRQLGIDPRGL
jgi:hypothetical protein